MNRQQYIAIEEYVRSCMQDIAHYKDHIYRVLYVALDIAKHEKHVDTDVLVASCLMHDIGRKSQFENNALSHAIAGSEMAFAFLLEHGWMKKQAERVKLSIAAHSFRTSSKPHSIEAKILFDADKLDATGALGIARTLLYLGQVSQPLYTLLDDGTVSDGSQDNVYSFFQEYKYKLEKLYDILYTDRGRELAKQRKAAAADFYKNMLREVRSAYECGTDLLKDILE